MTSQERHEVRYQRRRADRLKRKKERSNNIGGISTAMSFSELFKAGKKCCLGVRWKQSVQRFEMHLFSKTAVNVRNIKNKSWIPSKYNSFILKERGKIRPIDAPTIQDRQIHKAFNKNVLLPLYVPEMIWNNGASLKGKGFSFSRKMLIKDLHSYYRHYGTKGSVILLDFKKFFPSAPHKTIYERHNKLFFDKDMKDIANKIIASNKKDHGLPLGVEPSQVEMIALPSSIDNYLKCQLSLKYVGHYMDDYYILVPPCFNAKKLLYLIVQKASEIGLTVNRSKTKIVSIHKPFKFCKAKYTLTSSGAVFVNGNRNSVKRARRKM